MGERAQVKKLKCALGCSLRSLGKPGERGREGWHLISSGTVPHPGYCGSDGEMGHERHDGS
eukprot:902445-Rhodomonas_salina.1